MPTDDDVRDGVIAAANALLPARLDPVQWETISMDGKSIVLRGEGLVAKYHRPSGSALPRNDLRALEYVNHWSPGLAPAVVAAVASGDMVIMEDVGSGPSLADALLGCDADDAVSALDEFVQAVAGLHRATSGTADSGPLAADHLRALFDLALDTLKRRPPVDVPRPGQQAREELYDLFRLLCRPGPASVLSFGDMCPNNNVRATGGMRLIDVEGTGHVHPALDLAYLTMPFPSCWCSFDLPSEIRAAVVARYRALVGSEDAVEGLHLAQVFYASLAVGLIGPRAEAEDPVERWDGQRLPTGRARLLHQLDRALEHQRAADDLPALVNWLDEARFRMVGRWPLVGPVPLAPAFR
jgi:hypothetical protein